MFGIQLELIREKCKVHKIKMSPFRKIKFFLFPLSRAFARPTELQFTMKLNAVMRKLRAELSFLLRHSNQTTIRVGCFFLFNREMSFTEMKPRKQFFIRPELNRFLSLVRVSTFLINSLLQT